MKKKHIAFLTIGIIISIILFIIVTNTNLFKKDIWDVNAEHLRDSLSSINKDSNIRNINQFIPFEWDELYSFTPYTSNEYVYETIGYKWDNISETVDEGMNQIVFIKDDKVICYFFGRSENNKITFNFGEAEHEGNHIKLTPDDDLSFDLKIEGNGVRYFEYVNYQLP